MKVSLGSVVVITAVVYTALCFSQYGDDTCGPDSGNLSVI